MIGIWAIANLQRNKIQNQLGRISQLVLTSIRMSRRNRYGGTAMGRCSQSSQPLAFDSKKGEGPVDCDDDDNNV